MTTEGLDLRRRGLEEEFFRAENARLLDKLHARQERNDYKSKTGIRDDRLVDSLIAHKISPDTMVTVELVPLIYVAWADGTLDKKEHRAIISAAEKYGVVRNSPGYDSLEYWVQNRPGEDLLEMWTLYIKEFCSRMAPDVVQVFTENLLTFTRKVAEASGLFPGIDKVSSDEARMIERFESLLAGAAGR